MNATVHLQPTGSMSGSARRRRTRRSKRRRKLAGLKPEQVYVHNGFLGGGFGRRDANDEVAQAIAIAKVVQQPVKLVWTREEDTRQDKFRPHAVVAFKAAAGADGHADRMVDACRHLVDLRQSVGIKRPAGTSSNPKPPRDWPTTATRCRTRASSR